jgi:hypothetical protein
MSTATLSPPASRVKLRIAGGMVDYNFLRNSKVAFDYPNATLSLFPA